MMRLTDTVKHLIIINVIFFAAKVLIGNGVLDLHLDLFYIDNPNFKIWQFVTSMFMHADVMHIAFNMYGLYLFGSTLESLWGRNKFLFFYFATGIGAGLIYMLVNYYKFNDVYDQLISFGLKVEDIQGILSSASYDQSLITIPQEKMIDFYSTFHSPALGASGALYGVLVAFAFKFPDVELMLMFIPVPVKAKYFIPFLVAMDLFSGVTGFSLFGGGVAHFAHVGGAAVGYLLMLYFQKTTFKRWD